MRIHGETATPQGSITLDQAAQAFTRIVDSVEAFVAYNDVTDDLAKAQIDPEATDDDISELKAAQQRYRDSMISQPMSADDISVALLSEAEKHDLPLPAEEIREIAKRADDTSKILSAKLSSTDDPIKGLKEGIIEVALQQLTPPEMAAAMRAKTQINDLLQRIGARPHYTKRYA